MGKRSQHDFLMIGSILWSVFFLAGCEKYYLTVKRDQISRESLASTFVHSPDPRQENPPKGQKLILEWRLPPKELDQNLTLTLQILFRDYSQKNLVFPISLRRGRVTYSLLNEDYQKTKGLLTYKAEIKTEKGHVLQVWEQQLWTELILIKDDENQSSSF